MIVSRCRFIIVAVDKSFVIRPARFDTRGRVVIIGTTHRAKINVKKKKKHKNRRRPETAWNWPIAFVENVGRRAPNTVFGVVCRRGRAPTRRQSNRNQNGCAANEQSRSPRSEIDFKRPETTYDFRHAAAVGRSIYCIDARAYRVTNFATFPSTKRLCTRFRPNSDRSICR